MGGAPPTILDQPLPAWAIAGVRAEDDALVLDGLAAPPTAPPSGPTAGPSLLSLAPAHPSELTRFVPENAIAYAEVQGAGTSILNALALLRSDPMLAESLAEIDQVLTAFGGAEQLAGWVEDVGIVVMNDGGDMVGSYAGGLLLLAPDSETARAQVDRYRSLLALAALGGAVELTTETSGDVEVTIVTLTQSAGLPMPEAIQIRFAVIDRRIVVATTSDLMGQLLTDGDGSLAQSELFQRATARGLEDPRTTLYLSVEHLLAYGWQMLAPQERPAISGDVVAYLEPVDAVHVTATDGADGHRVRIVMSVSNP
jgi:hypothetical protein